jgi:hypothetical protein
MNSIRTRTTNLILDCVERLFDNEAMVILFATALFFAADFLFIMTWYLRR